MEKELIEIDYKGWKITSDILPAHSTPQILCMHGAGSSNRQRFLPMRQLLADNGISSCALDFLGHGQTGGNMYDSGLKPRTEQAGLVIEKLKMESLVLIGSSMGGFNAIKLTEIYPVKLLVLIVPAIDGSKLYDINFSEKFTSFIHKPKSWDDTDAWEILNKYKGKILIVTGGKDDVVPSEITQKIYDSAINSSHREVMTFSDAPHRIFVDYFNKHPDALKKLCAKIVELIK